MSSDDSSNAPRERRDAVREKALQVQARQKRTHLIRTVSIAASIVAVVAITAVVVTWAVSSSASRPMLQPSNQTNDGFVITDATGLPETGGPLSGTPTPTPTTEAETEADEATPAPTEQPVIDIRVYVDYLSTGSRDFQLANAPQLARWVGEEAATLTYYPVAMLTAKSNGTKYSLRAASAAACVATHSQESFFAFNHAMLSQQPEVDSDGYSDSELADMAVASGADHPKVVRSCIEDESYATWARQATERALQGLPDTQVALTAAPMVLVNGTPYVGALDDPKEFAQFVLTVASDAYYSGTTPTPTPTATP